MNRRTFFCGLTVGALGATLTVEAQQAGKPYRVVIVAGTSPSLTWHPVNAFQQTLRELGYVEGRNLILDQRFTEGQPHRFPELIADVLRLNPDVLVGGSSAGALAAKNATTTVPVVFVGAADPVGQGIVASLARPGGNLTGNSLAFEGFAAKWGQLIKEAVPHVSRVAAIWNSKAASKFGPVVVKELEDSARALGVRLDLFEVRAVGEIDRAFNAIKTSGAGTLIVAPEPLFFSTRARFVELAARMKVPTIYFFRDFVDEGGLMAYGPSLANSYRQGALYVDKILKGAKPGDLPVEQPTKFELVINLKTAKALGLTVPPSLLLRADQVIDP